MLFKSSNKKVSENSGSLFCIERYTRGETYFVIKKMKNIGKVFCNINVFKLREEAYFVF